MLTVGTSGGATFAGNFTEFDVSLIWGQEVRISMGDLPN